MQDVAVTVATWPLISLNDIKGFTVRLIVCAHTGGINPVQFEGRAIGQPDNLRIAISGQKCVDGQVFAQLACRGQEAAMKVDARVN